MARTINQIYNEMLSVKNSISELDGLTSTSNTAIWKLFLYVTSVVIAGMEQLWDVFKNDLTEIRRTTLVQTAYWWNYQMKNVFQYDPTDVQKGVYKIGSDLIPKYEVIDATKRIIKFASTKRSENQKVVNIKVAADDGTGQPRQLTSEELSATISFAKVSQGVGDFINVVSFKEDLISGELTIFYDGMYVESVVKNNVNNAIIQYLQNIDFDGQILLMNLQNFVENVKGVKNCYFNSLYGQPDGGVALLFNNPTQNYSYATQAGYAKIDAPNFKINMNVY